MSFFFLFHHIRRQNENIRSCNNNVNNIININNIINRKTKLFFFIEIDMFANNAFNRN